MTTPHYGVAIGHNVPDEDLIPVDCRNGEVLTERTFSDGGTREEGFYSMPRFDVFEGDVEFGEVMAQFGVLDAEVCAVTWRTRSPILEWKRYNGYARQPQPGPDGSRRDFFLRDYVIVIAELTEIEE